MTVVVDASALIRPAAEERRHGGEDPLKLVFAHLGSRFGLSAPALITWEVGNVIHKKFPGQFGGNPEVRDRVVHFMLRDVELDQPDRAAIEATARIVDEEGLTFYDASYLELAQRTGGFLLTEDKRLLESARAVLGVDYGLDIAGALAHVQDGVL